MYYRGLPVATPDGSAEAVVAYAESKDGMAWTKPDFDLFTVMGTRHNNVLFDECALHPQFQSIPG